VTDLLAYDEDVAFTLMDDAATVSAIVRRAGVDALRAARFGDWNGVELIGHVTDVAEVFAERVRRATVEDHPPTLAAIPEGMVGDPHRDPVDLSRRLLQAHQRIVALLHEEGATGRPAMHQEWGRVDAGHLATYHADHAHGHVLELAAAFPPA
jgi:hypothetical protein